MSILLRVVLSLALTAVAMAGSPSPILPSDLAPMIDHTLLKPESTAAQVERLCAEARRYGFASVCVNPCWVRQSAEALRGSRVKVCTVVGFPLGASTTRVKFLETLDAVRNGAGEIDMVLNVGALKSGQLALVKDDISAVVRAADGRVTKVILETCLLNDDEKRTACRLSKEAGASFVKTSTGFGSGGATVADVSLMRREVGPSMGVKASGNVGSLQTARQMVEAGANRLGCSKGVAIVTGAAANGQKGGY